MDGKLLMLIEAMYLLYVFVAMPKGDPLNPVLDAADTGDDVLDEWV